MGVATVHRKSAPLWVSLDKEVWTVEVEVKVSDAVAASHLSIMCDIWQFCSFVHVNCINLHTRLILMTVLCLFGEEMLVFCPALVTNVSVHHQMCFFVKSKTSTGAFFFFAK